MMPEPDNIIDGCFECPYKKVYKNWEGKNNRCKQYEIVEEHGKHGKAIELEDWEDIPDWCPLPPYQGGIV